MKIKPTQSVDAVRYVADEAEVIIRLVSASPLYYTCQVDEQGRIKFYNSGSTPTPHTLSGQSMAPGAWLVKAGLSEGGIAGDDHWHVWDNAKVLQYFEVTA